MRVMSTAPARISLFGGGSDIEPYASEYGGKVISMAINIRQHVEFSTGDDMWNASGHEFPANADPQLFYRIMDQYGLNGMHHGRLISFFDGVIGAGLGSSASSAVCLIAVLRKIKGLSLDRYQIAHEAWDFEVNKLGWQSGKQDQYASAFGGLNLIEFGKTVRITPIACQKVDALLSWSFLTYVGGQRTSHLLQKQFSQITDAKKQAFTEMKNKIIAARVYIEKGYIEGVAELLHDAWELKKKTNPVVTNKKIDQIYEYALEKGAYGGKLLGAGQGGYMYFLVPPSQRSSFAAAMKKRGFEEIDFAIDWNGVDSRVV